MTGQVAKLAFVDGCTRTADMTLYTYVHAPSTEVYTNVLCRDGIMDCGTMSAAPAPQNFSAGVERGGGGDSPHFERLARLHSTRLQKKHFFPKVCNQGLK